MILEPASRHVEYGVEYVARFTEKRCGMSDKVLWHILLALGFTSNILFHNGVKLYVRLWSAWCNFDVMCGSPLNRLDQYTFTRNLEV